MVGTRRKYKSQSLVPKTVQKDEAPPPTPSDSSGSRCLSEVSLRKLPRVELQKLAREYQVKANSRSDFIIQELLKVQVPKNSRRAQDETGEGPSKKRAKRQDRPHDIELPPTPESQTALLESQHSHEAPVQVEAAQPSAPPSTPRPAAAIHPGPRVVDATFDEGLFSGTESEMTEVTQHGFNTPVSSRSSSPFPTYVYDLKRCVTIMQEISAKDQALLNKVAAMRETAAKLRKRARDVREIVKAERTRRERMEAYFRYWQQIDPAWHRKWLYGEKTVPERLIQLDDTDTPAGPPTVANAKKADALRARAPPPAPAVGTALKPALAPEQVKQRRDAIIARQRAEQKQLDAFRKQMAAEHTTKHAELASSKDVSSEEVLAT
ncbi:hypothetical protein BS17DRAFT_773679 [Gyrodon lividus]|nr:hypothetical protein BS17DRAFT_773679 [Gyrodon lividus]